MSYFSWYIWLVNKLFRNDALNQNDLNPRIICASSELRWWPESMPEDMRLRTEYLMKYRDWKQKPHKVRKKEFYVPAKAKFKTDSEYEGNFKVF